MFWVRAVNTQKVRFFLGPTGTNTSARLLGEDSNGRDGWSLAWRYQDEALAAHLTAKAIGSGGTSPETVLGLYTPNPTADATNETSTGGRRGTVSESAPARNQARILPTCRSP